MATTSHRPRGWGVPVGDGRLRVAVYGGAGMVGSRIVAEALDRGHLVTSVTRTTDSLLPAGATRRSGDAADDDDVAMVSAQHDVVVSAIGPSRSGGRVRDYLDTMQTLVENVGVRRLVVVGSAGSLEISPGLRLMDTPEFSRSHLLEAQAQSAALDLLRDSQNLADWVYLSPAPTVAPGERTGRYVVGADTVIGSYISAEDLAVAVLDEVETPRHRRTRFCVAAAPRPR